MRGAREKPYVCVDIDLPCHPRLVGCADPAGCLGLWTAMICYAREHLTSGRVPKRHALALWADKKNRSRLADMVTSGLLTEEGDEYVIERYAPRNQTKEMVEAARESARKRMAAHREKQRDGSLDVRRTEGERSPDVPISTSTSDLCDLSEGEPEREPDPAAADPPETPSESRLRSVPVASTTLAPVARLIDPNAKLTDELRSTAQMLGVQDIEGAWVGFVGHCRSRGILSCDFSGEWQKWAVKARTFERRDRDRDAERAKATGPPDANPYDGPTVRAERRRRESEFRDAEKNLVPSRIGDLLKAVGGKPK